MSSGQSPFDEEFDTLVKAELEKWKVPGLSIAIIQGSQISAKVSTYTPGRKLTFTQDRHTGWQNYRVVPMHRVK